MIADNAVVESFESLRPLLFVSPKRASRNKETSVGSLGLLSLSDFSVSFDVGENADDEVGTVFRIDCTPSGLSLVPGKNFSLNDPGLIFDKSRSRENREKLSEPLSSRFVRSSFKAEPLSFVEVEAEEEDTEEDRDGNRLGGPVFVLEGEFAK